jgi:tetratricopeptide (TPR) repeat protein
VSSGSLVTRGPRAGRAVLRSSNAYRASVPVLALVGVMALVAAAERCRVTRPVVAAEPRDEVEAAPQLPSGSGSSLDGDQKQLNANEHITRAMRLLDLGRMKIAEKELRAAAERDSESGRPEFILGLVYVLAYDDSRSAAAHFREAARRTPDDALAHNNYAVCSYWCARSAGMVDAFRSALKHSDQREPVLANIRRIIVRGDINQRHMLTLIALYDDASANEPDGAHDDDVEGGLEEHRPRMFSADVVEEDRGESPRLLFRASDRLPSRVVRFAERAVEVD